MYDEACRFIIPWLVHALGYVGGWLPIPFASSIIESSSSTCRVNPFHKVWDEWVVTHNAITMLTTILDLF